MFEFLRQFLTGVQRTWQRLSLSARINIALSLAATIAIILVLVLYGSRPQFVVLYSGLDRQDSSAIIQYLEDNDIPYEARDAGATIMVGTEDLSDVRVALRNQGLPKSYGAGVGFEIFDEPSVMTSRSEQEIKYWRAVQGELQRMLNDFSFVRRSLVYIHREEESLFADEQRPTKAAVTLDVTRPLSREEIDAVLGVVGSFGGANLAQENITLATTEGQTLNLPSEDEFTQISNRRLDFLTEYERQRELKAETALGEMGVKSFVRVSLDINTSTVEETSTKAEKGTPVSEMITRTESTSEETLPEGPAGTMANIPEGTPGALETTESQREEIFNYEPSITETTTITPPGSVLQARAVAVVSGTYESVTDAEGNETGEREYVPRTDEQLETYRTVVATAVGPELTPEEVSVFDHPFEMKQAAAIETFKAFEWAQVQENMLKWGSTLLKVLLVLVGFFVFRRFLMRVLVFPEEEQEKMPPEYEPTMGEVRRREMAEEVERVSTEQPEQVASLLRAWLAEGEE
ncbi:MAG: flagellar basal-body MS-ring/collar protein FliF [Candidatus Hydrogenedentota bacterium]